MAASRQNKQNVHTDVQRNQTQLNGIQIYTEKPLVSKRTANILWNLPNQYTRLEQIALTGDPAGIRKPSLYGHEIDMARL